MPQPEIDKLKELLEFLDINIDISDLIEYGAKCLLVDIRSYIRDKLSY